jgi:hypothetical protein
MPAPNLLKLTPEEVAALRADYPQLSSDDVAFAALFARMKPLSGQTGQRLRFIRAGAG